MNTDNCGLFIKCTSVPQYDAHSRSSGNFEIEQNQTDAPLTI